ncbi:MULTISPECIES: phosphate acyltransferase [Lentibacter]|mgnify:FL=1|jgi:phosphate acetyltransferase|uniref:Phosphotransacetylase n=1 Tax=Lentibacter algarum TaxID=576131 RepID=A0A1H3GUC7_9RHOB|nr:phosphate acyltransferase [Lentibacter algarum]MCO4777537.1 phosphate acetyltransferase [Lentibacter algarum]MCO4827624.1 phosphate acetyltransferase [Lentibacter algarum]WIF30511.1 phosphate actetyl/butyryl transferase [Lentibacter algarum]SDY06585.1 phosphotransacetylase [Lentibacter algarum]
MEFLKKIYGMAREKPKRVVFPEADEPRIAEAMARLGAEGICEPLALGDVTEAQVQALVMARGMKEVMARRLLKKPLYRAAAMVAAGEADAMVAGADSPTRRVIEAAAMAIGPAEGVNTASSFFVMLFPDGREMIFADCALNLEPSAEELADIARASHASAKALLGHSEVAMLSFSTGTSGAGESVERVRTASELAGFVGPVQGDAALNPKVATKKGMGAGNANVLIFPSLDAGNIAYKLAQELAGAQALGPILQGFAKPVGDLSRGATVEDIVAVSAIVVALG